MNTLKHKDFVGTFNYIEEDNILHGKIEGIPDLVTFEGESIKEIKESFIEAVEDYIALCNEAGKEPAGQPYETTFPGPARKAPGDPSQTN